MKKNHFGTIIVGSGFAGLNAATRLGRNNQEVLIIDRTNHHLFQPLLYQVATASLSPADIAAPIREVLKSYPSVSVIMAEVIAINKENKSLKIKDDQTYTFENLIVAVGAKPSYFGHDDWQKYAPGLKNLEDALHIREKVLKSYELSEITSDQKEAESLTTFVIVGGGPTGVEMAGAIEEIATKTLAENFRYIDTQKSKIYLIEGGERVLSSFHKDLSARAKKDLEKMGVIVKLKTSVTNITEDGVHLGEEFIPTKNVIWAAGNKASPLLKTLNTETDKMNRVLVDNDCSLKENNQIFIIGDACAFKSADKFLPGLAPVAAQQGKYVADLIINKTPKDKRKPFKYLDKGSMATIGKRKAVMQYGKLKFAGLFAWLSWSLVHILFLVLFRNKVSIFMSWVYNYTTEKRGARLIKTK